MLAAIESDFGDALSNVSLASAWPHIESAIVALGDDDPCKRSDAADALLDRILHIVGETHRRLIACDEFENNEG